MNPHSYRLKGRDFVHQGKIEIDVNERAVFIRTQGCFFVYTNSDCFLNSLSVVFLYSCLSILFKIIPYIPIPHMVNGRRIFYNMCSLQESKTKTGFALLLVPVNEEKMLLLTLSTKNTSRNVASDFTCIYPDSQLYSSPSLSLKFFRASFTGTSNSANRFWMDYY